METRASCLLLCAFALAASAGAADFAATHEGRATAAVPLITPGFSSTLQLQRGLGTSGLDTVTDKIMSLPGAVELRQLGAAMMGFKNAPQSIPALPQSAVVSGPAFTPLEFSPQSDAIRMNPPSEETLTPALKRLQREIAQKTERLQGPIETISKTGASAASPDELHRLGGEIWDTMAARGGNSELGVKAGNLGGGASAGLANEQTPTVSENLLSRSSGGEFSSERGSANLSEASSVESGGLKTSGLSSQPGDSASAQTTVGELQESRPRGVALLAMDVVGQSLILSEKGPAVDASREAAEEVFSALAAGNEAFDAVPRAGSSSSAYDRFNQKTLQGFTGDAGDLSAHSGVSTTLSAGAIVERLLSLVQQKSTKLTAPRSGSLVSTPTGPGLWSWAALLPLLLLAASTLPEFR